MDSVPDVAARAAAQAAPVPQPVSPQAFTTQVHKKHLTMNQINPTSVQRLCRAHALTRLTPVAKLIIDSAVHSFLSFLYLQPFRTPLVAVASRCRISAVLDHFCRLLLGLTRSVHSHVAMLPSAARSAAAGRAVVWVRRGERAARLAGVGARVPGVPGAGLCGAQLLAIPDTHDAK